MFTNEKEWNRIITEMTKAYDASVKEFHKKTMNYFPEVQYNFFKQHLKNSDLILDVGCGSGRDTKVFNNSSYRVIAFDISHEMVKHASQLISNNIFLQANLLNLPFKNKPIFDAIWCSAVFLHIPKLYVLNTLKSLYVILKQGGIVYISLKEGDGEIFKEDTRYNHGKKFWSYFTKNEFEKYLQNAGFTLIDHHIEKSQLDETKWIYLYARK